MRTRAPAARPGKSSLLKGACFSVLHSQSLPRLRRHVLLARRVRTSVRPPTAWVAVMVFTLGVWPKAKTLRRLVRSLSTPNDCLTILIPPAPRADLELLTSAQARPHGCIVWRENEMAPATGENPSCSMPPTGSMPRTSVLEGHHGPSEPSTAIALTIKSPARRSRRRAPAAKRTRRCRRP